MNIKKSILKVFSVNLMSLISGLIISFFVPAILSIEGYANLKTYNLFISYIGLLGLGFIDGLYIKYGGQTFKKIDKLSLKSEHRFFLIMEFIISIFVFLVTIFINNIIAFIVCISIMPILVQSFFQYLFQSVGDFKKYSILMYITIIVNLLINLILVFVIKSDNFILYCLPTVISNLIASISAEIIFYRELKNNDKKLLNGYYKNNYISIFKSGVPIMIGNLAVIALFGIDRWFVKLFLTNNDFAYYSFAVSMLSLLNILVKAISVTFYSYLFKNNNVKNINRFKNYLLILGGLFSVSYFALSYIVSNFIGKYIPSLDIVSITFAVLPYMILINALYLNLYKVNKSEKKYLKIVVGMLLVSIALNIIAIYLWHSTLSIAFATVITLVIWTIFSTKDLPKVKFENRMFIYLFILTFSFLICANMFNIIIGCIVYLSVFVISTILIYNDVLSELKKNYSKIKRR